eukprot:TRINITY_DN3048_c0_g1_i2.p1 TRINITY_DN3048_c0_g1~~TRINITY_DN3048_c0_g1_i2.p1  ORF type:complete len:239 (+),score=39.64 TRINITY_DN3048_c0_g1_i2:1041-1757(+)
MPKSNTKKKLGGNNYSESFSMRILTEENNNINGFKLINYRGKSEYEILKEEVKMLKRNIDEIDKMNLPDDIDKFDPIELYLYQKNHQLPHPSIPPLTTNHLNSKAGSMYIISKFKDEIMPDEYNSKFMTIIDIGEIISLMFGFSPHQIIGSELYTISHKFDEHAFRLISYGENKEGKIMGVDCSSVIYCDDDLKPKYSMFFVKQVMEVERVFINDDLRPLMIPYFFYFGFFLLYLCIS